MFHKNPLVFYAFKIMGITKSNNDKKARILLIVPAVTASGGIKNYFQVLRKKIQLPVLYVLRGSRNWPYRNGIFAETFRAWRDLKLFRQNIIQSEIRLVQTSTSFDCISVIRDGLFIYFAKKRGLNVIVFFHGWKLNFESKIEKYFLKFFKFIFFRADKILVLSSRFKKKLEEWGYNKEIIIESTIVDEDLLNGFDFGIHLQKKFLINNSDPIFNLLFLARIEIEKGIYETINAFRILLEKNKNLNLFIAGNGREEENIKSYVEENSINNIRFLGYLSGVEKRRAFEIADVYILPSYTEGMPNSVLEAMAFGLPIITRSVGSIPEIIENGINGYHTDSMDSTVFSELIQKLIDNPDLRKVISINNYIIAKERYISSEVVKRIETIYNNTLL